MTTLVIKAGDDKLVPPQVVERYSDILPNVQVVTLPSAGHGLAVEQQDQVTGAITAFIASVR